MSTPACTASRAASLRVVRDVMAEGVAAIVQLADREVVRHDEASEAPFAAQNVLEQPSVGVRRHAVDLVVGRHHAQRARLLHSRPERRQERLAQHAHRDVDRRAVRARLRLAVRGEVLQRGDDVPLVARTSRRPEDREPRPHPCARRGTDPRRRSPRRGPSAARGRRRPRASAPDACRGRAPQRRLSCRRVRRDRDRTSPPGRSAAGSWCSRARRARAGTPRGRSPGCRGGCLDEEPLDVVGELGHPARGEPVAGVARPRHLPEPAGRRQMPRAPSAASNRPAASMSVSALRRHRHMHLGDLFLERHPREQVLDALVARQLRVLVLGVSRS